MISVKVEDTKDAVVINGHRLDLEQPIFNSKHDIIVLDSKVVIRMSGDGYDINDANIGRNVICFDANAGMKWRIAPSGFRVKRTRRGKEIAEPYSGIFVDEKRHLLCAYVPAGFCVDVDPETGEVSNFQQRLFG